ncbi:uncharacterized protein CLUP02_02637 [Colletotrichum lupini]|uniref:Uncharacterized protein n=1 Tax=Colletotrichum lupini TaxID=145971 RepID=A0A9Q8SHQ4_9PEZI|nr:uncharacterized protein CLUP02_02637 [Colletotrichum lupini]UQC77170.1 hypothetical protein CLUP02_02637 [Colletotrichum lupini]
MASLGLNRGRVDVCGALWAQTLSGTFDIQSQDMLGVRIFARKGKPVTWESGHQFQFQYQMEPRVDVPMSRDRRLSFEACVIFSSLKGESGVVRGMEASPVFPRGNTTTAVSGHRVSRLLPQKKYGFKTESKGPKGSLGEKQGSPIEFAYHPRPGAWGLETGETAVINNVVSWSTDDVHKDRRSPGRARPTREYATQNPFFNDIQARVVRFDIITAAI